jgi:hypothetical protein
MYRFTFHDLSTSWKWLSSFNPWPLNHQGRNPRYSLDRKSSGFQSQYGRYGDVAFLDLMETRTATTQLSSPQPVALFTELFRLHLQFEILRKIKWWRTWRIKLEIEGRIQILKSFCHLYWGTGPLWKRKCWRWQNVYLKINACQYLCMWQKHGLGPG